MEDLKLKNRYLEDLSPEVVDYVTKQAEDQIKSIDDAIKEVDSRITFLLRVFITSVLPLAALLIAQLGAEERDHTTIASLFLALSSVIVALIWIFRIQYPSVKFGLSGTKPSKIMNDVFIREEDSNDVNCQRLKLSKLISLDATISTNLKYYARKNKSYRRLNYFLLIALLVIISYSLLCFLLPSQCMWLCQ